MVKFLTMRYDVKPLSIVSPTDPDVNGYRLGSHKQIDVMLSTPLYSVFLAIEADVY